MNIIKAAGLVFDYIRRDEEDKIEEKKRALNHLNAVSYTHLTLPTKA